MKRKKIKYCLTYQIETDTDPYEGIISKIESDIFEAYNDAEALKIVREKSCYGIYKKLFRMKPVKEF